ncbi:MAG: U32 family peptidase, partial [Acidobacteria bacterium]|nr:U32 family peptidase [Acidobacteriota bacterium]
ALDREPASITLDYLDLFHVGRAVDQVKAAGLPVRIASPRILKPGEEKIAQFLVKQACPVLVRANGLLEMLPAEAEWVGDFSLNAANRRSAQILLDLGLKRITPTHDLNAEQVRTLAQAVGPEALEVVIYQHLPVFHTEHCVFCRFLSTGTSYKDCGRPCEEHKVALQDQQGRQHPVIADVGCRNTVFGWEAQEASRHLSAWLQAGLHHFRLEFTHETGDQLIQIVSAFRTFFDGSQPLESLQRKLKTVHPTTEGSLFVPPDFLGLPV